MQLPGTPSLFFLTYLLVLLPWMAFRSARRLRLPRDGNTAKPLPSRQAIWTGTLLSQCVLLVLAWITGSSFGQHLFAVPRLGAHELLAAVVALGMSFALRFVARALRSEDERRHMMVYRLVPRTARERALWAVTVLVASVAEEAAYRGVGMSILWFSLGNPWVAALVCATAFALAHWTQGWKSAMVIFVMALVMHGLVAYTRTLILAMLVHAVYDFVVGSLLVREVERYDRAAAPAG